jgi:hypothetical protein
MVRRSLLVGLVGLFTMTGGGMGQAAAAPTAHWTVLPSPVLPKSSMLDLVSCAAADSCLAIGSVITSRGSQGQFVAARLQGGTWQRLAVPRFVSSLSCPTPTLCEAIFAGRLFRWNGQGWAKQTYATPGSGGDLNAVTCLAPTDCIAVGQFSEPSDGLPAALMLRWDGQHWGYQPLPQPRSGNALLYGVACTSADACTAVGLADAGSHSAAFSQSIAYRFDGNGWTLSHPPDPPYVGFGELTRVACPSAHTCVAPTTVTNRRTADRASADVWHHGRWRLTPLPAPTASRKGESDIGGISCMSARACVAVGSWDVPGGASGALIEVWNGTSWRNRRGPLPLPSDGTTGTGAFNDISCWSRTTCLAVGSYTTATGAIAPLVEER